MKKQFKIIAGLITAFCLLTTQPALAETVTYYHTDPTGTPLAMTDSNGVKIWEADYLPFGEVYTETGTLANDRKFVGKERDEESNLDYFGARYHYAKIGRFLAVDPVRAVAPQTGQVNAAILKNPQRHNLYSYSLNNGYRNVDADGRFPIDTIWDIGNIVYDIATGDKVALAADTAALAVPYVPAGLSKIGKAAAVAKGIEAKNGLKIEGFTEHGVNRAIGNGSDRTGVSPQGILDALKNPLKIGEVKTDQLGRQSQRFIGETGEVVANPQTGRIISVNPTSTKKAERLKKQMGSGQ